MYNFKHIGKNVKISVKTSIYNPQNIEIGDNVRIDDFCILSAGDGGIKIGNNVHIACYSSLIGKELILLEDFCGISMRVTILSSSDDYSGNYLVGPVFNEKYVNVKHSPVVLKKCVAIGVNCTILPGVTFGIGSGSGVNSFINKNVEEFSMVGGVPAKHLFYRSKKTIELVKEIGQYEKNSHWMWK